MPRVLCCALSSEAGPHHSLLSENGFVCDVVDPDANLWDPDVLKSVLQGYDAVIAGSEPYPESVISGCPGLRVIARAGVGFDAVDVEACDRHRVVVTTTPGVNHEAVAEHTIALMTALSRNIVVRDRQVRSGIWERRSGPRLQGATLGLIGLGRIGQAVARRACGLGMHVLATDPSVSDEAAQQVGAGRVEFDRLLEESDWISLHAPGDATTERLIRAETLAQMKRGVRIINTARGQLIDEAALIESLRSGHVAGAALDVFDSEPLPVDSPLIGMDQVILTGHVAGLDDQSHEDTYRMIADTLIRLHRGQWPGDCIRNLKGITDWSWSSPGPFRDR